MSPAFSIKYWGTTGSYAAPLNKAAVAAKLRGALLYLAQHGHFEQLGQAAKDPAQLELFLEKNLPFQWRSTYGGNTTCLEIQTPQAFFVIDCGTGLRELGMELERRWNAPDFQGRREAHILFTHPHMDHTMGIPFFDPFMDPRNSFTLYASAVVLKSIDAVLSPTSPLSSTYFPTTFDLLKAIRQRIIINAGTRLEVGSTVITTKSLRHPGGCLGFRFECQGKSFVFCTDHEHVEAPDPGIVEFARGADLLYLDGQYRQVEYEGHAGIMGEAPLARRGWGHSSVEACALTAVAAGVRRVHIGHREPKRDDGDMAKLEVYFQQCLADALRRAGRDSTTCLGQMAYEGLTIDV